VTINQSRCLVIGLSKTQIHVSRSFERERELLLLPNRLTGETSILALLDVHSGSDNEVKSFSFGFRT
jgi:hypothetical protein